MGYIKQGENALAWGVIGKVEEPRVANTVNGNIQVLKFSMSVGANQDGTKEYKNIECWGALAQRTDIKQWNSAFVLGKIKTMTSTNKEGKEYTREYIRADLIFINETAKAFENIKNIKENDKKESTKKVEDIPDDIDPNGDLPF